MRWSSEVGTIISISIVVFLMDYFQFGNSLSSSAFDALLSIPFVILGFRIGWWIKNRNKEKGSGPLANAFQSFKVVAVEKKVQTDQMHVIRL